MFGGALKELSVGENGEASRAGALVAAGDGRRFELLAQHTARRARLFDFGDHGRALGAQRTYEIAHRRRRARLRFHGVERRALAGGGDLGALRLDDAFENTHRFRWRVKAMNSSSLCFAAPLLIAWLARSMPAFSESLRPAT